MRYVLDFGTANAGGTPTWTYFRNSDTGVALTPPSIVARGGGEFYFDWDWSITSVTAISFKATCAGIELSDVIVSTEVVSAAGIGSAGPAAVPWLWTAGKIINQAAVECGLTEVPDPYASTDRAFVQLRTLLSAAGSDLLLERDWPTLVKECTLTGTGAATVFSLPADFMRMVNQSGWNRSSSTPLAGPLSSQGWQAMKARVAGASTETYYRMVQNQLHFLQAPALGALVAFDYLSRYWAKSAGAETADKLEPSASGDAIMLEPRLMVAALKYHYKAENGEEATKALADYESALSGAASLGPAPVLNLAGSGRGEALLSEWNLPASRWGQ